jgi:hypothetical protein
MFVFGENIVRFLQGLLRSDLMEKTVEQIEHWKFVH